VKAQKMISIRVFDKRDQRAISKFYSEMEYSGGLNPSDRIVIAEEGSQIIGVLRVCEEHGHLLLRGMRVRGDFRRQGIGKLMLAVAETVIGQRTCYGLAYPHLLAFYGRIGFVPVDFSQVPAFLQARWGSYRERGVETVFIKRSALPPEDQ
jgi:GNAT superfamily N-acetyltransferase